MGSYGLVSLVFLEAIVSAGEARRAPVIRSLAESHFAYHEFELAMAACDAAARRTAVPVAIHLDHGASVDSAVKAINLGGTGVKVNASHEPVAVNDRIHVDFADRLLRPLAGDRVRVDCLEV